MTAGTTNGTRNTETLMHFGGLTTNRAKVGDSFVTHKRFRLRIMVVAMATSRRITPSTMNNNGATSPGKLLGWNTNRASVGAVVSVGARVAVSVGLALGRAVAVGKAVAVNGI